MIPEDIKSLVLIVAVMQKQGRKLKDIIHLLLTHGMDEHQVKDIIQACQTHSEEIETALNQLKARYSQDLSNDKLEELVYLASELYAYCDYNNYEVKQHMAFLGVDESQHQHIANEALREVQKSTGKAGNQKITLGIIVAIVGIPIMIVGVATGMFRIFAIPFGFGLFLIVSGFLQKNAI